jgi:hypothetical protein
MGDYFDRHYRAHAEAFRKNTRRYRARKHAKGVCVYGGCPALVGPVSKWLCDAHNELRRQQKALLRKQKVLTPA